MKLWFTSLLLLLAAPLGAEPAPPAPPITIEADRMELDQQRGTSIYRGNVVLVRGGLQLKADTITLYTVEKRLQRAVVTGKPATMVQQGDEAGEPIHARANWMEYRPQQEQLKLKGEAHLWRNGNEFSGEQISYDLAKETVKASGGEQQGTGRVHVILQPKEEEKQ